MLEECLSNSGPGSETEDFLLRAVFHEAVFQWSCYLWLFLFSVVSQFWLLIFFLDVFFLRD